MKHEMKYIYEVYQEKSFSQAAKNLFISQPALSSSIRKAEREIGFQIFDRNTLPIRLTEAGKLYIEAAEKIMAVERELDGRLSEMANLKTGRVVVAGANFFSACMLPPVIHTFVSRYPGVDLELVESDSMVLYEEALKDNIDLIFDAGAYDSSLFVSETLSTEHKRGYFRLCGRTVSPAETRSRYASPQPGHLPPGRLHSAHLPVLKPALHRGKHGLPGSGLLLSHRHGHPPAADRAFPVSLLSSERSRRQTRYFHRPPAEKTSDKGDGNLYRDRRGNVLPAWSKIVIRQMCGSLCTNSCRYRPVTA